MTTFAQRGDPLIRTRNAAILAHALQERYLPTTAATPEEREAISRWAARVAAVEQVARNPAIEPATRAWACALRAPRGQLAVLADLYHRDPRAEVAQPIEEIVTDLDAGGATRPPPRPLTFRNLLVHLDPRNFPSPEKVATYERMTGKSLPIAISRQRGSRLVSVHLPSTISKQILDVVARSRSGTSSKQEARNAAGFAAAAFAELLPPEQRALIDAAIATGTLSVRFTTQRDTQSTPTVPLVTEDNPPSADRPEAAPSASP